MADRVNFYLPARRWQHSAVRVKRRFKILNSYAPNSVIKTKATFATQARAEN